MFLMIMWHRMRRLLGVLSIGVAVLLALDRPTRPPVAPAFDPAQRLIGEDAADAIPPSTPDPDRTIFRRVVARLLPAPPQLSALKLK